MSTQNKDNGQLTGDDIVMLAKVEKMKAQIRKMDAYLKGRIQATVETIGEGSHKIAGYSILLKKSVRSSPSWKSIAHALNTEEEILAVQPEYTVDSVNYSAKLVS